MSNHSIKDEDWNRRVTDNKELVFASRYTNACKVISRLRKVLARRKALDKSWLPGAVSDVRTCGACTPAAGKMLWMGGGFSVVLFSGCDRPTIWPSDDLEIIDEESPE